MADNYNFITVLDSGIMEEFYDHDLAYALSIFELWLQQFPLDLKELETQIDAKDMPAIRSTLHRMKPSFTMVGNEPLTIETNRVEKGISNFNPTFEEVETNLLDLLEEMRETHRLVMIETENLQKQLAS